MAQQQQEFTEFDVDVNLEAVDAWDGDQRPLVAPGEYKLQIVHAESTTAQNTNNPMIAVTFEVVEALDPANTVEVGKRVYNNYVLTQKAMGRIKALMVACGAPLDKIRGSALMNAIILGTVYHSEGAGSVDENGTPREARTFANVKNERMIEGAPIEEKKAATPPIQRGAAAKAAPAAATKPNGAGVPRRA